MIAHGKKVWLIPEGHIPSQSTSQDPALVSHESACILNTGDTDAQVKLTLFFTDRDPVGPYALVVPAQRVKHVRFNDLEEPSPVPRDTDYASLIEADVPVVVQYTRLDSRKAELGLLSTLAYPS